MATLTTDEIILAQSIINRASAGVYELRNLYGAEWKKISSPTSFGARFKETVNGGYLKQIKPNSLKTNNHHTYEIYK